MHLFELELPRVLVKPQPFYKNEKASYYVTLYTYCQKIFWIGKGTFNAAHIT